MEAEAALESVARGAQGRGEAGGVWLGDGACVSSRASLHGCTRTASTRDPQTAARRRGRTRGGSDFSRGRGIGVHPSIGGFNPNPTLTHAHPAVCDPADVGVDRRRGREEFGLQDARRKRVRLGHLRVYVRKRRVRVGEGMYDHYQEGVVTSERGRDACALQDARRQRVRFRNLH